MNNIDRAKQFLPFDSLKGLREELRKREEKLLLEEKRILSEEKIYEINQTLNTILNGDSCYIEYYSFGKSLNIIGQVKILNGKKQIKINDIIINFEDIYDICKTII